jgi:hypothetical protein
VMFWLFAFWWGVFVCRRIQQLLLERQTVNQD